MHFSSKPVRMKGSVLVFSLIVLSFMLVSALSLAAAAVSEQRSSFFTDKSNRSFQAADSGVETILQQIYSGSFDASKLSALGEDASDCTAGEISGTIGAGTYRISFFDNNGVQLTDCDDTAWRAKTVKIKSEGRAGNTTRAVEVGIRP